MTAEREYGVSVFWSCAPSEVDDIVIALEPYADQVGDLCWYHEEGRVDIDRRIDAACYDAAIRRVLDELFTLLRELGVPGRPTSIYATDDESWCEWPVIDAQDLRVVDG